MTPEGRDLRIQMSDILQKNTSGMKKRRGEGSTIIDYET